MDNRHAMLAGGFELRVVRIDPNRSQAFLAEYFEKLATPAADVDDEPGLSRPVSRGAQIVAIDVKPLFDFLPGSAVAVLKKIIEAFEERLRARRSGPVLAGPLRFG